MKVLLIKASQESGFKAYKKYLGAPPQNIFSIAAATPDDIQVEMIDETADIKPPVWTDAGLVLIFASTPDVIRAYELAMHYKKLNKTVILAGLHASFMYDEAIKYADSVLVGEAENVWATILDDFVNKNIKPRYESDTPVDMRTLNYYPTNKIKANKYNGCWAVLVSRGCKHRCSFCLVPPFFKGSIRYRPVAHVIDEIRQSQANWIELHSDYLTADRAYAMELFNALRELNIYWSAESTINFANDDALLQAAAESGLSYLLVGLETPSSQALRNAAKGFVKPADIKESIRKLHAYDIAVDSAMIFGFDSHDNSIFKDTLDYAKDIDLDVAHGVVLIPFPGSREYEQMQKEGRILTNDWRKYDGVHAVFQPQNMTAKELEEGANWFNNNFYSPQKMYGKRSWIFGESF